MFCIPAKQKDKFVVFDEFETAKKSEFISTIVLFSEVEDYNHYQSSLSAIQCGTTGGVIKRNIVNSYVLNYTDHENMIFDQLRLLDVKNGEWGTFYQVGLPNGISTSLKPEQYQNIMRYSKKLGESHYSGSYLFYKM
jgi:hypothetical protein